jgi:hypothetical protein
MKQLLGIVALAALLPASAAAQNEADLQRADLVATCLVGVAGAEESALFHNLLLAVVNQDAVNAQTFVSAIVARTRDVAISQCNQPENWFELTWAGTALGGYIQRMLAAEFTEGLTWLQTL